MNAIHSPLRVAPLHPLFVAEVTGIDLRRPLTESETRAITQAMDQHAVLVFRDQDIDDDQQIAFIENFGVMEENTGTVDLHKQRLKHQRMNDISNLDEQGRLLVEVARFLATAFRFR